tara:strand:- start:23420 stop:23617 length:198 start_codon:yes stop_codon:yes gene_type:complete
MNNGYKALLFLIGVMVIIFLPPLMVGGDYVIDLGVWVKRFLFEAFIISLILGALIGKFAESEDEK